MIQSLSIRNFRGFTNLEVEPLPPVSVVTGANGAGKTTLLEAGFIMAGRFRPAMIVAVQNRRGMSLATTSAAIDFRAFFSDFEATGAAVFVATTEQGEVEMRVTRENSSEVRLHLKQQKGGEELSGETGFSVTSQLGGEEELSVKAVVKYDERHKPIGVSFEGARLGGPNNLLLHPASGSPFDAGDLERFGELTTQELTDDLIRLVRVIDDRVRDIRLVSESGGGNAVKVKLEGVSGMQPIGVLGGGVMSLFRVLVGLAFAKGGWMSWDEIENGLHHTVQKQVFGLVIEAARKMDTQLMMSTHSREALTALADVAAQTTEQDFAVIHIDRSVDNDVSAVVVNERDAIAALATGHELR